MLASFLALSLVFTQPPAPGEPLASGAVKNDDFSEATQLKLLAGCTRIKSLQNDMGTATIVGIRDGIVYLLTARHVIKTYSEITMELFPIGRKRTDPIRIPKIDEVVSFPLTDVALIRVSVKSLLPEELKGLTIIPIPKPYDRPRQFPYNGLSIGCDYGALPTCKPEVIKARQLVRRSSEQAGAIYWQVDNPPISGRSGGPLFDKKGRLIGICVAAMGNAGYFAYLDEIQANLKSEGYSWIWDNK